MTSRSRPCLSAGRTHRGKVRQRNEDAFLDLPEQGLWVVADGMGGHHCGDMASQLIVSSLAGHVRHGGIDQRLALVRRCLQHVHQRLVQAGMGINPESADRMIGSTVVALLIEGLRATCVWAGDSRCYLWRDEKLYQLSSDHSLFRQLIDKQQMSPAQAARHPAAYALTQAIGGDNPLELDIIELAVRREDVFLLCSDGLYQALDHNELGNALSIKSPQMALDYLFAGALRGTASDNLTAVVVKT